MKPIQIVHDSVVFQKTDAIVNAANTTLMGGDGVDGAIHDAAGDRLYWYFNDLGCTCQPGEAIESPGFNLPAKHIIHTVGPIWHEGKFNEPEILAECYRNCLDEAVKHDCRSISFCCISVGVYRYPLDAATRIALKAISPDRIHVYVKKAFEGHLTPCDDPEAWLSDLREVTLEKRGPAMTGGCEGARDDVARTRNGQNPGVAGGRATRNGQNPGVAKGKADAQRASEVSPHFIKSGHGRGDENAN